MGEGNFAEGTNPGVDDFIAKRRQALNEAHQPISDAVKEDATLKVADAMKHKKKQAELAARAGMADEDRKLKIARKDIENQPRSN